MKKPSPVDFKGYSLLLNLVTWLQKNCNLRIRLQFLQSYKLAGYKNDFLENRSN